jgi:hypothetical protein
MLAGMGMAGGMGNMGNNPMMMGLYCEHFTKPKALVRSILLLQP